MSGIFVNLPNTLNPTFVRVRRVSWCVYTWQYIGSLKQILFFPYFFKIFLNNIYSFPIFILYQCCQQIFNLKTYLVLVQREGCWRWIFRVAFLLKNSLLYLNFVSARTVGERGSAKFGQMCTGEGDVKITENVWTSFMDGPWQELEHVF